MRYQRLKLRGGDFATLRQLAKQAVWQEIGGRAAGWHGQTNPFAYKSQRQMNEEGAGRTHWVGMPDCFKGFGMNRSQIRATLERAIAGRPLGSKQISLIRSMLHEIDRESDGSIPDCPF